MRLIKNISMKFYFSQSMLNCNYARLPIVMSKLDKKRYDGVKERCDSTCKQQARQKKNMKQSTDQPTR